MAKSPAHHFVVCIGNAGFPAALEKRKIYIAIRDSKTDKNGLVRIIDESGEAYLYPKSLFKVVTLPASLKRAVLAA